MHRKLYLHIGSPKTASSSIQNFLFHNRDKLKEEGIFYPDPSPDSKYIDQHAHSDMVESFSKTFRLPFDWRFNKKFYYRSLMRETCNINILSAEPFFFENPHNLSEFFSIFDVKVICFIRNYFDFCSSRQKQMIKGGFRKDLFGLYYTDTISLFGRVDDYVALLGRENCFLYNFDRIRHHNVIEIFLKTVDSNCTIDTNLFLAKNLTPMDAATMFMYQLSFFPFKFYEWFFLRNNILRLDLSSWKAFRATFLPPSFFSLDSYSKSAIRRQGELLQDPDWYDYTMTRGEELAAIENHDLPPEIQHDIWEKLSDEARSIILRYWSKAGQAKHNEPLLPALEKIAPDVFEQMTVLRHGYTVCLGNSFRHQQKIEDLLERERARERERRRAAMLSAQPDTLFSRLRSCLAPLVSTSARQAYDIRRSGLFDTGWYLEHYSDVAEAGIDPVVHYVRFGAKEGRDPAPWFSTSAYLQANPDVAASGVNPFYHYIRHGVAEGRGSHEAHC